MRRILHLTFMLAMFNVLANAQSNNFFGYLATDNGGGAVTVVQDRLISELVFPSKPVTHKPAISKRQGVHANTKHNVAPSKTRQHVDSSKSHSRRSYDSTSKTVRNDSETSVNRMHVTRRRYRANGYRVQVFTGGNSRTDRLKAERMQSLVKKHFPELSVYIHFVSPRWVCRVGDFKSRQTASQYAAKIRRVKGFQEARVVNTTVLLPY